MGLISKNLWIRISLFYFALVALLGCGLRLYAFVDTMPFEYRNLIHSHSHVAMLGWVFNMLLLAIVSQFSNAGLAQKRSFKLLFWGIQISVIGMFVSFILQGYALWSISFSTLHILLTYALIVLVVRDLGLFSRPLTMAEKFLMLALLFLFLSSFGPWGLAVLGAKGMAGTPLYKSAIYWFLHFTYNGWMTMMPLAVWIKIFDAHKLIRHPQKLQIGLYALGVSIPLSFLLSLFEFGLNSTWHILGFVIASVQLIGALSVVEAIDWRGLQNENPLNPFVRNLIVLAIFMLLGKVVFQLLSAIPWFQEMAFFDRDILVFYLHWVLIGWVSAACLAFGFYATDSKVSMMSKTGVYLLFIGLFVQEVLLGSKSIIGWSEMLYRTGLLLAAAIMFAGVLTLLLSAFSLKKHSDEH